MPLLWLEVDPAWTHALGYTPADLVAELRTLGYDRFLMVRERIELLNKEHLARGGNLLCARAERHQTRLRALTTHASFRMPSSSLLLSGQVPLTTPTSKRVCVWLA